MPKHRKLRLCVKNTERHFIMNDSVDLAVACGADGIHVGQDDAPVQIVKKIAGQNVFVGVSTK